MTTKQHKHKWAASSQVGAQYLGTIEVSGNVFEVLETEDRLIFGGACNAGFLESGFIRREDDEQTDDTARELIADLEVFYGDGPQFVSRIVCNDRM